MFGKRKPDLRDDIATAAEAGQINRAMFGKTVRRLESKLMNGEQVVAMTSANHDKRAGVLVHTNYRLLFTVDSVAGNTTDSVALERVTSVQWVRNMATNGGSMTVGTAGRELAFTLVPEGFAMNLQAVTA